MREMESYILGHHVALKPLSDGGTAGLVRPYTMPMKIIIGALTIQ